MFDLCSFHAEMAALCGAGLNLYNLKCLTKRKTLAVARVLDWESLISRLSRICGGALKHCQDGGFFEEANQNAVFVEDRQGVQFLLL